MNAPSLPCRSSRLHAAIIGAQKCGTTTLAAVLGAHPDICLARGKEAHLFDRSDVQRDGLDRALLDAAFPDHRPGQIRLDATPSYLYLPGCLEALAAHSPEVRVVVLLRSPASRAVSHHQHERRLGTERLPLPLALVRERRRLRRDDDPLAPGSAHRTASYLDRSRYPAQIERLRSLGLHAHFVLLDELVAEPRLVVTEVLDFLGLDPLEVSTLPRLNAGDGRRRILSHGLAAVCLHRHRRRTEILLDRSPGSL